MFCYQPERTFGLARLPGVQNSATELMTPDIWTALTTSPQTEWLVAKHREVKASLGDPRWLQDEDYLDYVRRTKNRPNSKACKAFMACDTDEKRVALWCNELKKRLPFIIFVATYPERAVKEGGKAARWRNQKMAILNGLVVLDIDHVDVKAALEKLSGLNFGELGILLVYITPGGEGLKIVFKARLEWGNLIDNQLQMAKILGLKADTSCKDAARGAFLTTKNDIIFINEKELFTYENPEYNKKFAEQYHNGDSQPTLFSADDFDSGSGSGGGSTAGEAVRESAAATGGEDSGLAGADALELKYHGVEYGKIVEAWLGGKTPGKGDRHAASLKLAIDLRYVTDNDPKLMERILRALPWVDAIVRERGEDVAETVKSARAYKMYLNTPKRMREALEKVGAVEPEATDDAQAAAGEATEMPLRKELTEWGAAIKARMHDYPCLQQALINLPETGYAAGLFATGAFFGTLMTRTWYRFYHRPEELRRLNYCVMIIGDPASGKSFATRLHTLIAAPIKAADNMATKAINQYKEETRTKGSNKEKPKKPNVVMRDLPSRTANGVFIQNMINAVETIDGQPFNLHMLTFDSELDNATLMAKGGQWIDKSSMELKAFHNEEDGQAYANLDSYTGTFHVYWNYVYTGTPLSLQRKVTERNFGSGLATRLAVIPLPPSGFKMMALQKQRVVDVKADETLKEWAFKLDQVKGELPLWPLVEECWEWTNERMEIAGFNQDKADELLLKRVAYYGICISAPFILMRHWQQWKDSQTFDIDATDRSLCRLVLDIQYRCQHHFFYQYAQAYFDNMTRDQLNNRQRVSKYDQCYAQLPEEFTVEDVMKKFSLTTEAARMRISRLFKSGDIDRISKGVYRKLKNSLS